MIVADISKMKTIESINTEELMYVTITMQKIVQAFIIVVEHLV